MGNEDGEKTEAVIGLVGHAPIRGLAALNSAGQIQSDTDVPDISIAITSLLRFSHGLEEHGIKGDDVASARCYFKKCKFTNDKGFSGTKEALETTESDSEAKLPRKDVKDPWV